MDANIIIPIAVIALVVAYIIAVLARAGRSESDAVPDDDGNLPEAKATAAKVISKRADIERSGNVKSSSHHLGFYVTFQTDDGVTEEFAVSQDIFDSCEPGMTGTLIRINGHVLGFETGDAEE